LGYDDIQNAINMAQSIMRAFRTCGEVVKNGVVLDFLELGAKKMIVFTADAFI
jgi:hypothetical protein